MADARWGWVPTPVPRTGEVGKWAETPVRENGPACPRVPRRGRAGPPLNARGCSPGCTPVPLGVLTYNRGTGPIDSRPGKSLSVLPRGGPTMPTLGR